MCANKGGQRFPPWLWILSPFFISLVSNMANVPSMLITSMSQPLGFITLILCRVLDEPLTGERGIHTDTPIPCSNAYSFAIESRDCLIQDTNSGTDAGSEIHEGVFSDVQNFRNLILREPSSISITEVQNWLDHAASNRRLKEGPTECREFTKSISPSRWMIVGPLLMHEFILIYEYSGFIFKNIKRSIRWRPPCTNMPWNIPLPLVVLWGVCWMFYNSRSTTPQWDEAEANRGEAALSMGYFDPLFGKAPPC